MLVGRRCEVGEQRQRLVGIVDETFFDGSLVELSDLWRDLLEARIAGEGATRRRSPARLSDRGVGLGTFSS